MTNRKLYFKADVTDWRDEKYRAEVEVRNLEDVVALREDPAVTPTQVARMAVVAHLEGEAKDLLPENRDIIQTGALVALASQMANQKETIELKDGRKVHRRALLLSQADGTIPDGDGEGEPPDFHVVRSGSPEGHSRAIAYLRNKVPGYVRGRLVQLVEEPEVLRQEAEYLKVRIDAMVAELAG